MRRHSARFLIAAAMAEGLAMGGLVAAWQGGLVSDAALPWALVGTVLAFAPLLAAAAISMRKAAPPADAQAPRRPAASSARGSRISR